MFYAVSRRLITWQLSRCYVLKSHLLLLNMDDFGCARRCPIPCIPVRLIGRQSLEDEMVRAQVLRVVSLPLWHALSPGRLQLELHAHEALARHWKTAAKKEAKAAKKAKEGAEGECAYMPIAQRPDVRFLPSLLDEFLAVLDKVGPRLGVFSFSKDA